MSRQPKAERSMPVPIYFRFDDREAHVTQDEAGEIANALSPGSYLHNQILARP